MKKDQYYSYVRNNYFFGKLMTVRDFECEQDYFNTKRCLGNKMLNGAGIVCGLNVLLVDNKTISIESGVAVDYSGREIVVADSVVKKIDSIEGFNENCDKNDLYLCIEYKENLEETSFSIAGSGKDSSVGEEYNRIKEGYRLFFTSKKPDIDDLSQDSLLINKVKVYDRNGVTLSLEYPRAVNPGNLVKVSAILEKNNVQEPVNYNFSVSGSLFKGKDGEEKVEVKYQESEVRSYKTERNDFYLWCDAVNDANADFVIDCNDFSISVGNNFDRIEENTECKIDVTSKTIMDYITDLYYSKSFEDISKIKENQNIYLARMNVVSNQSTYFIENFEKHPFKQYVISNQLLSLISKGKYFDIPNNLKNEKLKSEKNLVQVSDTPKVSFENVKSGVEKIDLGLYAKAGKIYYSCEFVHGLGYGNVGVILSIENKNSYVTNDPNSLVFGDATLFKTEECSLSIPKLSVGAVVNTDKGTMQIGLKLLEKTSMQSIEVRWWVFKVQEEKKAIDPEELSDDRNVSVVVSPNTLEIKPLEQVRLSAKVNGSVNQDVKWSLVEEGSGSIDDNGMYTAPAKCGVYEVRATSEKFVNKYDSSYIVVSD